MDALGFGALSAMVGVEAFGPVDSLYLPTYVSTLSRLLIVGTRNGIWLLCIGLVTSRTVALFSGARAALRRGSSARHLVTAITAPALERTRREGAGEERSLPAVMEASGLLCLLLIITTGWIHLWDWATIGGGGTLGFLLRLPVSIPLLVLPVLLGRVIGARGIHHWPATGRMWVGFWRSDLGSLFFRISSVALKEKPNSLNPSRVTEAFVAGAAADLFEALPRDYQDHLSEIPELLKRLQANAEVLRRRETELGRALGSVGTANPSSTRRSDSGPEKIDSSRFGSVEDHRTRVVEDLAAAEAAVSSRRSATVAALENLRLSLLRLQAGPGSPEEFTDDLAIAREVTEQVQALLDGEGEIRAFLVGEPEFKGRSSWVPGTQENQEES
jgi:hypothetical protein